VSADGDGKAVPLLAACVAFCDETPSTVARPAQALRRSMAASVRPAALSDTIDPPWDMFGLLPEGRGTDWYSALRYS
jgi:hypothetical protein